MVTIERAAAPRSLGQATMRDFADEFQGTVVVPGDAGYDAARAVWNGMIDRRPLAIARCAGPADVAAGIRFARSNGLPLAVRGGGHSVAGLSTCDDGLVLDLSPMKGIAVDPVARTARVEPGVLLGELDRATQEHGLAVPAGQISHTGVAGLTLGGGVGWLMRKHGLTIDSLRAVEAVTADGRLLRADASEHPDLYWAVRGGGGNFGVITSFEFALHPVGPEVLAGPLIYTLDKAPAALRHFRDVMAEAPDELTAFAVVMTVPPVAPFPTEMHHQPALAIDVCYAGAPAEGERTIAPLRAGIAPDLDLIQPLPFIVRQSMLDWTAPHGRHYYDRAHHLRDLDEGVIAALIEHAARFSSPFMHVTIGRLGGAISRVAPDATAFPHRDAAYLFWIIGAWAPEDDPTPHRAWISSLWQATRTASTGGIYVNAVGDEGEARVRAAYGVNYDRLAAIKHRYDPTNLFRRNQNIVPAR